MLFNIDLFCIVIAIVVFILQIYISYIFTVGHKPSNIGLFENFKLKLIRLASVGIVSKYVNSSSTVVEVSDDELNELLQIVFAEIGNSTSISVSLLKSLGLYTPTVISYLENLGYIIQ
jgi:hypothetical protein